MRYHWIYNPILSVKILLNHFRAYIFSYFLFFKQGGTRPLDTLERKIERRERERKRGIVREKERKGER